MSLLSCPAILGEQCFVPGCRKKPYNTNGEQPQHTNGEQPQNTNGGQPGGQPQNTNGGHPQKTERGTTSKHERGDSLRTCLEIWSGNLVCRFGLDIYLL